MDKSIVEINRELVAWNISNKYKTGFQVFVSGKTGISQSQVSRILNGKSKKLTPRVKEICKYANIQIKANRECKVDSEILEVIRDVWDGTEHSKRLIIELLNIFKEASH